MSIQVIEPLTIGAPSEKLKKAVKKAAAKSSTESKPRADIKGWVLCPGDAVLIISRGEEYHGLFGKVDAFPTTLELSSYIQIDGRPSTSGRMLLPNAQLRWMGPDESRIDLHRPNRPGQRVRVVLDNEALATPEMKSMEGQLGTVTELDGASMFTVKFEDPALAAWPAAINGFDLLVVPTPVVQYVPEPVAEAVPVLPPPIEEESDLPWQNKEVVTSQTPARVINRGPSFNDLQAGVASVAAGLRVVPMESIVVSTNTRKVFDESALAELAESIKAHGILQPIVVRPNLNDTKFELVAGGRRYRAAQLAGLTELPATVRNLTDREFLEVQLLENLQRVDVRPSDEAHAFSKLLGSNFTAEEIALKVGKPVKFVLQRARLVALIPFWMELLEAERLPLVAAHELARLPPHSQVVVKKWMEEYKRWELAQTGPLEAGTIRHAINQEVTRQLAGAAFPKDDATLCLSAGPCTTCPKNSANNRGLFEEVTADAQAGKCLDAACFAQKKEAFVLRRQKEVAGTDVPLISSSYASPPKGALGYKFYDTAKEGDKGAVPALVVDGTDAGQTKWVKLNKNAPNAEAVAQNNKAEKEAGIRVNRVKKMTNELLADELRDTFTEELLYTDPNADRSAARALLGHWLRNAFTFGRTRTPNDTLSYLVKQYGWQEPTEADLDNRYESDGPNPHKLYINRQLDAMPSLLDLVALFFDLKIRDGLDQTEYTSNQASLVKALPKRYQGDFDVAAQAENRVQERYYAKKKGATA